jgi:hypothetical protein
MRRISTRPDLALLAMILALTAGISAIGQEQPRRPLGRFMRQKLTLSQSVLEGLTTEDFDLVAKGARSLRELSEDARWRVTPNVNYLRLSNEFQDLADDMEGKAKQKNLDGATLAYVKMTMLCVKCHQLTRENRWGITLGAEPPRRGGE